MFPVAIIAVLAVVYCFFMYATWRVARGLGDTMRDTLRLRSHSATNGDGFLEEVCSFPGGETVRACIQCGTCSGSCPAVGEMEYGPRQINAMVRAGMRDEVLSTNSMWCCLSCYLCTERCPRGVQVTDIMYTLKRLAIRQNGDSYYAPTPVLERTFVDCVNLTGRLPEIGVTGGYYWRTNPIKALAMIPLGLKLIRHHRMGLIPSRVKGMSELRAMIRKAQSLEREHSAQPESVPAAVPA